MQHRPIPLIFSALCACCLAQDPSALLRFEVASVKPAVPKPAPPGDGGRRGGGNGGCPPRGTFSMDGVRVAIGCANLEILIAYAFRVPPSRVAGPDWLTDSKFDVMATIPNGVSESQVPEMLQALLTDRFKVTVHRGTKDQEVCALVVAKGGLKVKEAAARPDNPFTVDTTSNIVLVGGLPTVRSPLGNDDSYTLTNPRLGTVAISHGAGNTYRWEASDITFPGLADLLDKGVGFVPEVIDRTGLKGRYQVDLRVSLRDAFTAAAASPADMQDALMKAFNVALLRLGLQLERRKGPVETIVVDHAERAPSGN